ncbi:MAG: hypothetical protein R3360_09350, partial [Alphaproteobacteria bacterium]|nr:hypothetical protein [Alphaproteobacteria bacterium]
EERLEKAAIQSIINAFFNLGWKPKIGDRVVFDRFMSEQITLTRLSEAVSDLELIEADLAVDIAKAAALKSSLASLAGSPALTRDAPARHAELSLGTEQLLLNQGQLAGELSETLQRWRAFLSAQTGQKGATQPGRIRPIEQDQPDAGAAQAETPQTEDALRFAGRKALVSIRPAAIEQAESTLRPLLEQVQGQYPDVAFDLENRGAGPQAVDAVLAVMREFGIETAVYDRPLTEGEEPVIRLYPR